MYRASAEPTRNCKADSSLFKPAAISAIRETPQPPQRPPFDLPESEVKPHAFVKADFDNRKLFYFHVLSAPLICMASQIFHTKSASHISRGARSFGTSAASSAIHVVCQTLRQCATSAHSEPCTQCTCKASGRRVLLAQGCFAVSRPSRVVISMRCPYPHPPPFTTRSSHGSAARKRQRRKSVL